MGFVQTKDLQELDDIYKYLTEEKSSNLPSGLSSYDDFTRKVTHPVNETCIFCGYSDYIYSRDKGFSKEGRIEGLRLKMRKKNRFEVISYDVDIVTFLDKASKGAVTHRLNIIFDS